MNQFPNFGALTLIDRLSRLRERRRARIAERLMSQLPDRTKRDIGWPPHGDLDLRHGS